MSALTLSTDRKTSPAAFEPRLDKVTPRVHNAFAILPGPESAGGTCPGATSWCKVHCYALKGSGMRYPAPRAVRERNTAALRACSSWQEMAALLQPAIAAYRAEHAKHAASEPMRFRIHSDGDMFSTAYARAWCVTARENGDIAFWTYTRSFGPRGGGRILRTLAQYRPENLALYISADPDNHAAATAAAARYGLPIAAVDTPVSLSGRKLECPETFGRVELVTRERGGACNRCTYCIDGRGHVVFR